MRYFSFILFVLFFSCSAAPDRLVQVVPIEKNWRFAESFDEEISNWHGAKVPGTIHTDLMRHEIIPDPHYACNEAVVQWVGNRDWYYNTTIEVDDELLKNEHIDLVFEGLDTYAEVYLNGQKVLDANNMFRKWTVSCKSLLKTGHNELYVKFASAEAQFLKDSRALGYPLPGGRWVFARKAPYHFGWDWGPKLVTAGIWKPVYLQVWNNHLPGGTQLYGGEITDEEAHISAQLSVKSTIGENAVWQVIDKGSRSVLAEKELALMAGSHSYKLYFSIENPKLWWPHDMGEPYLYELEFRLRTENEQVHSETILHGIRTVEVVTDEDSTGQSMYFKINGIRSFMKGANYIPQHSFLPEVTDDDYRKVVENAVKSNMNMLRVWGGGVYASDAFYHCCDSLGILVWQDFMFACAMYPSDDDFVQNVKQEATEQILRLRNHASLAMYCGNNEVAEGWANWQWQKTYNIKPDDSATIWHGYERIFQQLLPNLVQQYDADRFYEHSSPLIGWGHAESLQRGSAHYWGVWWGMEPFETYLEKVPRFMSEFGFQSMPALATWHSTLPDGQDTLFSPALRCHQKHKTGYQTIDTYLERESLFPTNLEAYIYESQLLQAKGIGLAIEAHRKSQPHCMGTLYWQLNDCWPVTSWSGMDVNGNWKALQYKIRTLYDHIMVSLIDYKGTTEIALVSDFLYDVEGILMLEVVDFKGNSFPVCSKVITLKANGVKLVVSLDSYLYKKGIDTHKHMLRARFKTNEGKVYDNVKFMEPFGKLVLPEAKVTHTVRSVLGGYEISLRANAFAAHVQLSLQNGQAWFKDNYFHLWPSEERKVFCQSDLSPDAFNENLQVIHLQPMLLLNKINN